MNTRFATVLSAAAGLVCAAESANILPSPPRTVTVREREAPLVIRAALLQSTLLVLPEVEKVATVFGGDTVTWVFDGGHVASRFLSIKPKVASSTTDVHIVSDHGNEYTFQLKEITGEPDPHFDSKVLIEAGDKRAQEKQVELPVFLPAAEVEEKVQRLQRETDAAKAEANSARQLAQMEADRLRSELPAKLHFDYSWDQAKGAKVGLQQIWRDDRFTYLRGHFGEPPVLYELKDGKGSLINFDFANGLYIIPKTLEQGYLAIGKQRMDFRRVVE